jgi:predicted Fe-Mo cluster-binding NifX family protein
MDATFSAIIQDTGPAAAQILIDDGVDVVIFTPV